jgi:hypothetical protein
MSQELEPSRRGAGLQSRWLVVRLHPGTLKPLVSWLLGQQLPGSERLILLAS